MPQFRESFMKLVKEPAPVKRAKAAEVKDLPLVKVRPEGSEWNKVAVMITGNGGWVGIDKEIGGRLAAAEKKRHGGV